MISEVISWKFNDQPGMRCEEIDGVMTITEFPGGIPSQTDQDLWTAEYAAHIQETERIAAIKAEAHARILALDPSWTEENHSEKQRNTLMSASLLINKKADGVILTADEITAVSDLVTMGEKIAAIREVSNQAEINNTAIIDIIWP